MHDDLKSKIKNHCDLYNKAEKVFKKAQLESLELDTGVLNEFRYCARAQTDLLELIVNSDGAVLDHEIISALEVANRALLCAINDSIDTIVNFAKIAVKELEDNYSDGDDIASIYGFDKYLEFWNSVKYIEETIAESREHRDSRLSLYCELVESSELKSVTDFCSALKIIESHLRKTHNTAKNHSSLWYKSQGIQLLIGLSTAIASVIAIASYYK